MNFLCALLATGTMWAAVASILPDRSAQKAQSTNGPATAPSTQPTSLALYPGEEPDEWESYQKMHAYMVNQFIRSPGFGDGRMAPIEDRLRTKRIYADGTRYIVGRVQLISLNGGKEPFAYDTRFADVSKKQIKHAGHIPVDDTILSALDELKAGKEVVLTGPGDSRELIGAVRASASCTKCHEVAQGTLLGAFRYPLEQEARLQQRRISR
jgi:hypothetical protein